MIYTKKNIYDVPETTPGDVSIKLAGVDYYGNSVELFLPDLSTVFVGAPGVGKTTALTHCIDMATANPKAVTVILDIKGEYVDKCFRPGDVVLSMYDLPHIPKENQVRWSLMKEALLDSNPESVLFEIAQMIFKKARETSQNPVFVTAAMLVFYGQLVHIFRSCNGKIPFNNELITKVLAVTDAEIYDSVSKYADLFAVRDLVSKKENNITAYGVRMELKAVLLETFVLGSNFCAFDSRFSIREFINEGCGRKLFIEFDFANRESSSVIVRLLLDLALKESLSGPCLNDGDKTRYNFFLDEYAYLPSGLSYLDAIKEVGRGKGCRLYAGFQSINQLYKMYKNQAEAANDFATFSNVISFRTHDKESMVAVTERAGCEYKEVTTIDALCNVNTESKLLPVIEDETLVCLDKGEAVVLLDTSRPFWIRLNK